MYNFVSCRVIVIEKSELILVIIFLFVVFNYSKKKKKIDTIRVDLWTIVHNMLEEPFEFRQ